MKIEDNQGDWVQRQREVQAWRDAAVHSLSQPYFDEAERKQRAAYYNERADRLEGKR